MKTIYELEKGDEVICINTNYTSQPSNKVNIGDKYTFENYLSIDNKTYITVKEYEQIIFPIEWFELKPIIFIPNDRLDNII